MQLSIQSVCKQYRRDFWGLRSFSLELEAGVLGLLGPNGAGKSTLMRILATVTGLTEGTVTWKGVDISKNPDELRQVLGYLPQDFGVYPNLNAREFLEYIAAVKGLDAESAKQRIDELLELVNLTDAAKRPLGGYSGGMRQRVGIAQALLNDPQLLIVDEPTTGLHLDDINKLIKVLRQLVDKGNTVVVIEHNIDFIKCSDWAIDLGPEGGDKGGYIVAEGTPLDISKNKKSYTGQYLR